jgi:protein-S-isoprenylcysteine O-methyltransferase Ste14
MDAKMDEQNERAARDSERARMSQINLALGVFVCFFASVVLVSIFFTETLVGKMTNLGAGLILLAIGIIMILRSKNTMGTS